MWKKKTEKGYYTVYYCPGCRCQRPMHTIDYNIWKCDVCDLEMKYNYKDDKLHLI